MGKANKGKSLSTLSIDTYDFTVIQEYKYKEPSPSPKLSLTLLNYYSLVINNLDTTIEIKQLATQTTKKVIVLTIKTSFTFISLVNQSITRVKFYKRRILAVTLQVKREKEEVERYSYGG